MVAITLTGLAVVAAAQAVRMRQSAALDNPPPHRVTAEAKRRLPERPPVAGERVVLVHKADRVLAYYRKGKLAAVYPIALGPSPAGHKAREGDGRTPEGEYSICTRNDKSKFHVFLGLSYPETRDADAALRRKVITKAQRDAIAEATRVGQAPPWDTPLGGEVGIHGGGSDMDWTAGCIALENAAMDVLWAELKVGDPVVIEG